MHQKAREAKQSQTSHDRGQPEPNSSGSRPKRHQAGLDQGQKGISAVVCSSVKTRRLDLELKQWN